MQPLNDINVDDIKYHSSSCNARGVFIYFCNGEERKSGKKTYAPKIEGVTPALVCNGAKRDTDNPDGSPPYTYLELHMLEEEHEEKPLAKAQHLMVEKMEAIRKKVEQIISENQTEIFKKAAGNKPKKMSDADITRLCSRMWNKQEEAGKLHAKIPYGYDNNAVDPTKLTSLKDEALVYDQTTPEKKEIAVVPSTICDLVPRSIAKVFLRLSYVSYTFAHERFNFGWQIHQILILKYLPLHKTPRQMKVEDYEREEIESAAAADQIANVNEQEIEMVDAENAEEEDEGGEDEDEEVGSDDSNH